MTNEDIEDELYQICMRINGEFRSDYSGRAMYGRECIAIVVDENWQADKIEAECKSLHLPDPTWDSMGLGAVAYWPSLSQ